MPLRPRHHDPGHGTARPAEDDDADGRAAVAGHDPARWYAAVLRTGAALALAALAVLAVYLAWWVIKPLIVSAVLTATLWPWVSAITSVGPRGWRLPRAVAAALVYAAALAGMGGLVWLTLTEMLPHLERLLETYPGQTAWLRDYLEPFRRGDLGAAVSRILDGLAAAGTGGGTEDGGAPVQLTDLAVDLFGGLLTSGLVLVFTFFLLLDGDRYAGWALALLPRSRRERARSLGLRARDRVSRWVLAQLLYFLGSFAVVAGAMWALGLPSPWLYGLAAALMGPLPGVGPAYAAVPALLVALEISFWQAGAVLAFGVSLWAIDTTVVSPRVYGALLRLPMFVVFLSMLLGAALMGAWGALIAPPVAAAVHTAVADRRD